MNTSTKVLLAPDALIAFIDRAHPHHIHAGAFFRYFAQQNYSLFAPIPVILSVHEDLSKNISASLGKDFLKALSYSAINPLSPEESELRVAMKTVLSHSSSEFPLSEALLLVMAERRGIPSICTFSYLHTLFGVETFYLPV